MDVRISVILCAALFITKFRVITTYKLRFVASCKLAIYSRNVIFQLISSPRLYKKKKNHQRFSFNRSVFKAHRENKLGQNVDVSITNPVTYFFRYCSENRFERIIFSSRINNQITNIAFTRIVWSDNSLKYSNTRLHVLKFNRLEIYYFIHSIYKWGVQLTRVHGFRTITVFSCFANKHNTARTRTIIITRPTKILCPRRNKVISLLFDIGVNSYPSGISFSLNKGLPNDFNGSLFHNI